MGGASARDRRMRAKGVTKLGPISQTALLSISDERWSSIAANLPHGLAGAKSEQLREAVLANCSDYLTRRTANERAVATAAAVRRAGKRQLAHMEQLAAGLRTASDAWTKIGRKIHDDRLSDL